MKLEKKAAAFDVKNLLDKLRKTDFDGHTNFASFTSEQKLSWLSNAAQFWLLANKNACPAPAQGSLRKTK